jgi:hypothetical protein
MRWAGNVTRTRRGMHMGFWSESQKEGDHRKDLDVGGRIILKWIVEKSGWVLWTGVIRLKVGTSGGLF